MTSRRRGGTRILDRLFDRRPDVRRAVLRRADQERNVMPTACVKSGERTEHAIRCWALDVKHADRRAIVVGVWAGTLLARAARRPVLAVAVPVADRAWRTWQSRLRISVAMTSIGAAFLLVGVIRGLGALIAVGVFALALGWLNRVRAWHNAWVGFEYRSATGEIIVTRVHSAFDAEAGQLYRRAVNRRL